MSNLEIKQNSLLFCNPELAKEYDNEKNSIPLSAICAQSAKKVWWICSGCGYHTSFREQAIYYYIKKYFPDAINSYNIL